MIVMVTVKSKMEEFIESIIHRINSSTITEKNRNEIISNLNEISATVSSFDDCEDLLPLFKRIKNMDSNFLNFIFRFRGRDNVNYYRWVLLPRLQSMVLFKQKDMKYHEGKVMADLLDVFSVISVLVKNRCITTSVVKKYPKIRGANRSFFAKNHFLNAKVDTMLSRDVYMDEQLLELILFINKYDDEIDFEEEAKRIIQGKNKDKGVLEKEFADVKSESKSEYIPSRRVIKQTRFTRRKILENRREALDYLRKIAVQMGSEGIVTATEDKWYYKNR